MIGETRPSKEIQTALDRLVSEDEVAKKKANEPRNPQDLWSLGQVDPDIEKIIFGYDLLVLIPLATPSSQIQ